MSEVCHIISLVTAPSLMCAQPCEGQSKKPLVVAVVIVPPPLDILVGLESVVLIYTP